MRKQTRDEPQFDVLQLCVLIAPSIVWLCVHVCVSSPPSPLSLSLCLCLSLSLSLSY